MQPSIRLRNSKFLTMVLDMLKESDRTDQDIAKHVPCTRQQIYNMRHGCPSIPSVALCERIYEVVSGKEFKVA